MMHDVVQDERPQHAGFRHREHGCPPAGEAPGRHQLPVGLPAASPARSRRCRRTSRARPHGRPAADSRPAAGPSAMIQAVLHHGEADSTAATRRGARPAGRASCSWDAAASRTARRARRSSRRRVTPISRSNSGSEGVRRCSCASFYAGAGPGRAAVGRVEVLEFIRGAHRVLDWIAGAPRARVVRSRGRRLRRRLRRWRAGGAGARRGHGGGPTSGAALDHFLVVPRPRQVDVAVERLHLDARAAACPSVKLKRLLPLRALWPSGSWIGKSDVKSPWNVRTNTVALAAPPRPTRMSPPCVVSR